MFIIFCTIQLSHLSLQSQRLYAYCVIPFFCYFLLSFVVVVCVCVCFFPSSFTSFLLLFFFCSKFHQWQWKFSGEQYYLWAFIHAYTCIRTHMHIKFTFVHYMLTVVIYFTFMSVIYSFILLFVYMFYFSFSPRFFLPVSTEYRLL